ncbi:hypothetical protein PspLS_01208 [Pyricularia sp. CBS 133598]|nr:hypothetical protein PspLS_01208 [Pyricularia sp. CBS 133598]
MSDNTTAQISSRRSGRVRPEISYKQRDDKDNYDELRRAQGYTVKRQRKDLPSKGHQNGIKNGDEETDAFCTDNVPDLLDDVLNFPPEELEAYEGWVELESDPASRKLPDSGFAGGLPFCEEIFSMDETEIAALRKPIYGFIFLFECDGVPISDEIVPPPSNMWFAAQTASNSCATVALLNVLMNCDEVAMGDKVRKFKEETADMVLSHRGAYLSQDKFLRSTHNTFARRLDLMDADLGMMNQWEERNKRQNKGKSGKRKRKALDPDSAKHYVGYIPHDGQLWELDGLDGGVICLGPYEGDWACAVIPHIQRKVEELGLQANLLALSHNPLASVRQKLAANMACYEALQKKLAADPALKSVSEQDSSYITCKQEHAEQLEKMGLTYDEVVATEAPQEFLKELDEPEMTPEYADATIRRLRAEQRDLRLEYDAARESGNEDLAAARRRCQDYTPLVHGWLRAMGEAGVLEALADSQ